MIYTIHDSGTMSHLAVLQIRPTKTHPLVKMIFHSLETVRHWIDGIEIHNRNLAWVLSKAIPNQCPFERNLIVFGHKIGHIPPLCQINPFYEQLVGLRFRAVCYLADRCGESI